jgi:drug/metabolite transporter (DMT)-like permease
VTPGFPLPIAAIALAFASAIIHALWNVMLKRTKDLDAAAAGVFAVSMVLAGGVSLIMPGKAFPNGASVAWGLAAGLFEGCYFVGLVRSLERASLGWSYGWMRGSSIVMVWPVSVLLMGESFRWSSLACVLSVCAGLGLLGFGARQRRSPGALHWAFFTGLCIACFNLFYKLSLAQGAQPLALFSLSMAVGLPIQTCVRIRRQGWVGFRIVPERPGLVVAAGLLCTLGFTFFLMALSMTGAGAVTTIRNTSVAFVMVFSIALGERPRWPAWLGAALVTLGAAGLGWK